jgi:5-methylcytosine-specific restriction endonuclease McrA
MLRAEGRFAPQKWTETRQENRERRRARMKGVYVGPKAPRFKIADRDGWRCGLCGGHIPRVVQHGHPLYLTIDHTTPLALGGEHSPSNVQAAHATCNYSKGARLDTAV